MTASNPDAPGQVFASVDELVAYYDALRDEKSELLREWKEARSGITFEGWLVEQLAALRVIGTEDAPQSRAQPTGGQVQAIVTAYQRREANVSYDPDSPWPDQAWPYCARARQTAPDFPGQPYEDWGVVREAVPHDHHIDNGGNTRCPGQPGIIPAPDLRSLRDSVDRHRDRAEGARASLVRAERDLAAHEAALAIVSNESE